MSGQVRCSRCGAQCKWEDEELRCQCCGNLMEIDDGLAIIDFSESDPLEILQFLTWKPVDENNEEKA